MGIKKISMDTIVALCTPQGSGAIALIRISGDHAISITSHMCELASKRELAKQDSHTIHFGSVIDTNNTLIDRVLFLLMRAPRTFTGHDTVEITCHNNPFIINEIIQQAITYGARTAQPGEFTKQSVLSGKLDLVQAEALNELIHANTQVGLKKALAQLDGTLSSHLASIEKLLLKALTLSEASFEFLDEEAMFDDEIRSCITSIQKAISKIKIEFDQQKQIRQGIRIALIGSVNAGKSSLFNVLLKKERAIVTPIAGTTRDTVEAGIYRYGTYLTLIDTAGLRSTNNCIEQEGIKRSWQEAAQADIILLVKDSSRAPLKQETDWFKELIREYENKIIEVHNKADLEPKKLLCKAVCKKAIAISCTTRAGLDMVEKKIEKRISTLFEKDASPFLLNQRQFSLVLELENKLSACDPLCANKNLHYELLSFHLKEALASCAQITGKTIQEQLFNEIFSSFCVGK